MSILLRQASSRISCVNVACNVPRRAFISTGPASLATRFKGLLQPPTTNFRQGPSVFTSNKFLAGLQGKSLDKSNGLATLSAHSLKSFESESTTTNTANTESAGLPPLSPPAVSNWLFLSAALVFGIVVVGGVTRLTESGLSIVEWRPISGTLPPLSQAAWEEEFEKYKATPEFKLSVLFSF